MTKKELMIKAHQMTKEIKAEYPGVDYKFQLGLCLAYLHEEGEVKMVELKGSEKQVAWANDIREVVVKGAKALLEERREEHEARGKKATLRRLEEARKMVESLETEESSKYFIDEFSYILRCMKDYEITAEMKEVSLDLVVGYRVKRTFGI